MPFENPDIQVDTKDGHIFILLETVVYDTNDGEKILIPQGTESDGASIPQIFWDLLPPFGPYFLPAYMHDFLYQTGLFVRSKCDNLLYEAMRSNGVGWIKAHVIYYGVRIGGWAAWDEYRNRDSQK